ncbi:unnamed protein product [Jaminaea pallidilutea]
MGGSSKDHRDVYYRQSKIDGYRARSAYKLLHLDEQFGFFGQNEMYALGGTLETELKVLRSELQRLRAKDAGADADDVEELEEEIDELQSALEYAAKLPSTSKQGSKAISRPTRAVDLCAAPGSWSQVLVQRLPTGPQTRIVSVDLQPMAPIAGVHQILGDITTQATAHAVANALAGENNAEEARAQLIVCDGAPDVTGIHDVDEYLQAQLLLSALQITMRLLEAGGTFIAKIFCQKHSVGKSTSTLPNQRGDTSALLVEQMKQLFELVDVAKPRSSRIASHEHFIVCRNFRPPPQLVTPEALSTPLHDLAAQYLKDLRRLKENGAGARQGSSSSSSSSSSGTDGAGLAKVTGLIAAGDLSAWSVGR